MPTMGRIERELRICFRFYTTSTCAPSSYFTQNTKVLLVGSFQSRLLTTLRPASREASNTRMQRDAGCNSNNVVKHCHDARHREGGTRLASAGTVAAATEGRRHSRCVEGSHRNV